MAALSPSTLRYLQPLTAIRASAARISACPSKSPSRCFKATTNRLREPQISADAKLRHSYMARRETSVLTDADKSALLDEIPDSIRQLEKEISKVIVGQREVIEQIII